MGGQFVSKGCVVNMVLKVGQLTLCVCVYIYYNNKSFINLDIESVEYTRYVVVVC